VKTDGIKISLKEKIGYSVGDTASNLFFQTIMLFLPLFYTDVFGISPAAVGTMFLVTRIWDAVNDPMMGMIADRTNTKWGKFRPFLLWFAVPFGIFGVLTFTTPDFAPAGKLIYAYVTYTIMMMLYTVINVPYSALMGVISPNSMDRTVISSFRFVAAFAGGLIVQGSAQFLVRAFGKGNDAVGWQWAMGILSAMAVILFLVTFATTKERVPSPQGEKKHLKQDLKDLFNNKPWVLVGSATVFQLMFISLRSSTIAYYFKYFVQDQEIMLFGNLQHYSFAALTAAFLMSGTVFTILGAILTKFIAAKFDKGKIYAVFMALGGISTALFLPLGYSNIVMMFILQIICSFTMGPISVLQWAMYTDTADFSEWKFSRRITGLIMSASLFALKLGLALGGALLGWILNIYHFSANIQQASNSMQGLRMMMSLFAAVPALVGFVIMYFYPLTNKRMAEIEVDLNKRRK